MYYMQSFIILIIILGILTTIFYPIFKFFRISSIKTMILGIGLLVAFGIVLKENISHTLFEVNVIVSLSFIVSGFISREDNE